MNDHALTFQVQIDVRDNRSIGVVADAIYHAITSADLAAFDDIGQVTVRALDAPAPELLDLVRRFTEIHRDENVVIRGGVRIDLRQVRELLTTLADIT